MGGKDVVEVGEKCGVICKQVHFFLHEVCQARQGFQKEASEHTAKLQCCVKLR